MSSRLLSELIMLRNKMGTQLAFLGTSIAMAIAIATPAKNLLTKVKTRIATDEVGKIDFSNVRTSLITLGIGPRGGMPSSKLELIKVAQCLGLETSGTVSELKTRCKEGYAEFSALMAENSMSPAAAAAKSQNPPFGSQSWTPAGMPPSQVFHPKWGPTPPPPPPPKTAPPGVTPYPGNQGLVAKSSVLQPPHPELQMQPEEIASASQSQFSESDFFIMTPDDLMGP